MNESMMKINAALSYGQTGRPKMQSSIGDTLDQLEKGIAAVFENAERLIDPLLPVLAGGDPRSRPECMAETVRAPASCQMDERLVSFVLRLGEINSRLVELKARIQL